MPERTDESALEECAPELPVSEPAAHPGEAEITARLNRLYENLASGLDPVFRRVQRRSPGSGKW